MKRKGRTWVYAVNGRWRVGWVYQFTPWKIRPQQLEFPWAKLEFFSKRERLHLVHGGRLITAA